MKQFKTFDKYEFRHIDYKITPGKMANTIFDHYQDLESDVYDMHYELEIGVVLKGRVIRRYKDKQFVLSPGDIWMIGMWEPHGFELEEVPCEVMCIGVLPEALNHICLPGFNWISIFLNSQNRCPYIKQIYKEEIIKNCYRQHEREVAEKQTSDLWRYQTLSILLLYILDSNPQIYKEAEGMEYIDIKQSNNMSKMLGMIVENKGVISVTKAANECMMSTSHFSREFKKLTGTSFAKFALGYRVKQSAIKLLETDTPIKNIAKEFGFNDASHYVKCFTNYFSMSPSKYRDINRNR